MDLSEAMKSVLKNKSKTILGDFRKEDLKKISKETFNVFVGNKLGHPRHALDGLKSLVSGFVNVLNGFPRRAKNGFSFLREDFLSELDRLEDQKQKTIFCLKFAGALSRMSLGSVYGLKSLRVGGRYAVMQVILIGICMEAVKVILSRFLDEVEKELTDENEIKNIRFFRKMIWNATPSPTQEKAWMIPDPGDPAFQIVESFKAFILSGKRT